MRLCEACERGDHWLCGQQTWCECDCVPEMALEDIDFDDAIDEEEMRRSAAAKRGWETRKRRREEAR